MGGVPVLKFLQRLALDFPYICLTRLPTRQDGVENRDKVYSAVTPELIY